MGAKKRGLGRGLDALLGLPEDDAGEAGRASAELRDLPLDCLERGRYQPRTAFDPAALQELADSIQAQGVVQPLVVRPLAEQRWEIVAGERRWRAAQLAGLETVPAIVRDIPDEAAVAVALIENLQREDLNPLEAATALQRLVHEFGLTHQAVAEAVGRSRAAVTNLLRLLELNEPVKALIGEGRLEMGHARALAALKGDIQTRAAGQVAERGLSVRQTEALVRRLQEEADQTREPPREDPDVRRLQDDLTRRLGAPVRIQQGVRGRGKVVIQYSSLDELDGILDRIR
ncbi:ParB/RepB/Spo0J family partition protein [Alkalilimnicola ehrlichii MLHE-1]|uniref:Probable chromosome-partitioning protein ParB n=1 Tax=Alkalilimnicola ehrlichii (strain ATCC BAA-1101 / DSM 17681 / MLHE-1) TaxID=187272 RepID=Q0A4M0_ALKEH|nr:ParB/RepB/Spo0J family partition protein [Alkalilimnicola ehrlichii]ABI58217.1 parB-like partition protein [Alkalilimnicola ehrlichii MLHE-1]